MRSSSNGAALPQHRHKDGEEQEEKDGEAGEGAHVVEEDTEREGGQNQTTIP